MGNESRLKSAVEKVMEGGGVSSSSLVEVVGLDMEDDREAAFDEAVHKASLILGDLDALVHCFSYEGSTQFSFNIF